MKKVALLTVALMLAQISTWACTVCKEQQPKFLKDISHGTGPESNWDYMIIITAVAVVLGTLAFSLRFLVKPGETDMNHIKQSILNPSQYE
jgi:hypothetical protein